MGIINLSQDSFYSKSILRNEKEILDKVSQYLEEGVDIIDLGAASTRAGSQYIDQLEETKQLVKAYELIRRVAKNSIISIDTMNSNSAEELLSKGADMINDVSFAERDPRMLEVIAKYNIPYIGMHMRGTPETMQNEENLKYSDLVSDVIQYISKKKYELLSKGIHQLIIDPGFGFSKSLEQNYELLKKLKSFQILDCPILIGISRKSMITKVLHINNEESLNGTSSVHMIALLNGANILRVHDVKEAKQCVKLYLKYKSVSS